VRYQVWIYSARLHQLAKLHIHTMDVDDNPFKYCVGSMDDTRKLPSPHFSGSTLSFTQCHRPYARRIGRRIHSLENTQPSFASPKHHRINQLKHVTCKHSSPSSKSRTKTDNSSAVRSSNLTIVDMPHDILMRIYEADLTIIDIKSVYEAYAPLGIRWFNSIQHCSFTLSMHISMHWFQVDALPAVSRLQFVTMLCIANVPCTFDRIAHMLPKTLEKLHIITCWDTRSKLRDQVNDGIFVRAPRKVLDFPNLFEMKVSVQERLHLLLKRLRAPHLKTLYIHQHPNCPVGIMPAMPRIDLSACLQHFCKMEELNLILSSYSSLYTIDASVLPVLGVLSIEGIDTQLMDIGNLLESLNCSTIALNTLAQQMQTSADNTRPYLRKISTKFMSNQCNVVPMCDTWTRVFPNISSFKMSDDGGRLNSDDASLPRKMNNSKSRSRLPFSYDNCNLALDWSFLLNWPLLTSIHPDTLMDCKSWSYLRKLPSANWDAISNANTTDNLGIRAVFGKIAIAVGDPLVSYLEDMPSCTDLNLFTMSPSNLTKVPERLVRDAHRLTFAALSLETFNSFRPIMSYKLSNLSFALNNDDWHRTLSALTYLPHSLEVLRVKSGKIDFGMSSYADIAHKNQSLSWHLNDLIRALPNLHTLDMDHVPLKLDDGNRSPLLLSPTLAYVQCSFWFANTRNCNATDLAKIAHFVTQSPAAKHGGYVIHVAHTTSVVYDEETQNSTEVRGMVSPFAYGTIVYRPFSYEYTDYCQDTTFAVFKNV